MKTKVSCKKILQISKALRFQNAEVVEAKGNAGGIALLWMQEFPIIKGTSERVFECTVMNNE